MFLKGIFVRNALKYMDTLFLTPLGLLYLLSTSVLTKNPMNFVGDHQMNIPTTFGSKEED